MIGTRSFSIRLLCNCPNSLITAPSNKMLLNWSEGDAKTLSLSVFLVPIDKISIDPCTHSVELRKKEEYKIAVSSRFLSKMAKITSNT